MRRMMIGVLALAAVCAGASIARAEFKVGFVLLEKIRAEAQPYRDAATQLQRLVGERQQEGQRKQAEIAQKLNEFNRQQGLMSAERKAEVAGQIENMKAEYERWAADAQQQLSQRQLDLIAPIDSRALEVIKRLAGEQSYDLVLDGTAIAYLANEEENDLTQAIIDALNQ